MSEDLLEKLTLGEIEEFENYTGLSLGEIGEQFQDGNIKTSQVIFIIYLMNRRENPDYTLEDARKIPLAEVERIFRPQTEPAQG